MEKQELYRFRIPYTDEGRALLKAMRKTLNRNSYSLNVRYSGARPQGTDNRRTHRYNATSIRVYITSHIQPENRKGI